MTREATFKHNEIYCENCHTNQYTVYDSHHGETYCTECGTVIIDTTHSSIVQYMENEHRKEMVIWNLHHKKRKQS